MTGDSVLVDPEPIEAVKAWPKPISTREVESFLGFVNYHREHIPHLAEKAASLYALTGKASFKWMEEHQQALFLEGDVTVSGGAGLAQEGGNVCPGY